MEEQIVSYNDKHDTQVSIYQWIFNGKKIESLICQDKVVHIWNKQKNMS